MRLKPGRSRARAAIQAAQPTAGQPPALLLPPGASFLSPRARSGEDCDIRIRMSEVARYQARLTLDDNKVRALHDARCSRRAAPADHVELTPCAASSHASLAGLADEQQPQQPDVPAV